MWPVARSFIRGHNESIGHCIICWWVPAHVFELTWDLSAYFYTYMYILQSHGNMQFKAVTFTVSLIINFNVRASCLKICTVFILNLEGNIWWRLIRLEFIQILVHLPLMTVNFIKISSGIYMFMWEVYKNNDKFTILSFSSISSLSIHAFKQYVTCLSQMTLTCEFTDNCRNIIFSYFLLS